MTLTSDQMLEKEAVDWYNKKVENLHTSDPVRESILWQQMVSLSIAYSLMKIAQIMEENEEDSE